ncbi:MAG: hypothetical protein KC777_30280, partial [Cyanobacteria bacterium HKST-UBA02]|nr:hypothetical protein [Cyanobacteria bacterium HKST-UBA02]
MFRKMLALSFGIAILATQVSPQEGVEVKNREPIAFIGHGAVFDANGNEINVTPQFLRESIQWYFDYLYSEADPAVREAFDRSQASFLQGTELEGQSKLLADSIRLDSLLLTTRPGSGGEIGGKVRMLEQLLLTHELSQFNQPIGLQSKSRFEPPAEVVELLTAVQNNPP